MRRLYLVLILAAVVVFLGVSALLARAFSVDGAERSAITDLVKVEARGDERGVISRMTGCAQRPACQPAGRERRRRPHPPRNRLDPPDPALDRLLAHEHDRHRPGRMEDGSLAADRPVRPRPPRRRRRSRAGESSCSRSARGSRATPTARRRSSALAAGPHRPAIRLTRGAALTGGQPVGEAPVIAQPHASGHGVGQRQASAREISRTRRPPRVITPSVVGSTVGLPWRRVRAVAQRGNHQHGDARQAQEVNSGDHQHQLSLA